MAHRQASSGHYVGNSIVPETDLVQYLTQPTAVAPRKNQTGLQDRNSLPNTYLYLRNKSVCLPAAQDEAS
jgi:hypothetical protein